MPADAPLLHHVVWCMDAYLVPRSNGELLIGATVEEMGFDATPTAGGVFHLLRGAWELLPAIYDLPLVEIAVGFRPTSRDDAPILGDFFRSQHDPLNNGGVRWQNMWSM